MIKEILQIHWVTCSMSALTPSQCLLKEVTTAVMTADAPLHPAKHPASVSENQARPLCIPYKSGLITVSSTPAL